MTQYDQLAIDTARNNFAAGGHNHRTACAAALASVPNCDWSVDQLKAQAFGKGKKSAGR